MTFISYTIPTGPGLYVDLQGRYYRADSPSQAVRFAWMFNGHIIEI